jgi:hypothetical protein
MGFVAFVLWNWRGNDGGREGEGDGSHIHSVVMIHSSAFSAIDG